MMGWTMGPNKTCWDALMLCNKNGNSPLNFGLQSSIGTCSCHFTKIIPLFIEFWIFGLNLPLNVNHYTKIDFTNLLNGLVCSPNFVCNAHT
jgi:hypothetical protein